MVDLYLKLFGDSTWKEQEGCTLAIIFYAQNLVAIPRYRSFFSNI